MRNLPSSHSLPYPTPPSPSPLNRRRCASHLSTVGHVPLGRRAILLRDGEAAEAEAAPARAAASAEPASRARQIEQLSDGGGRGGARADGERPAAPSPRVGAEARQPAQRGEATPPFSSSLGLSPPRPPLASPLSPSHGRPSPRPPMSLPPSHPPMASPASPRARRGQARAACGSTASRRREASSRRTAGESPLLILGLSPSRWPLASSSLAPPQPSPLPTLPCSLSLLEHACAAARLPYEHLLQELGAVKPACTLPLLEVLRIVKEVRETAPGRV